MTAGPRGPRGRSPRPCARPPKARHRLSRALSRDRALRGQGVPAIQYVAEENLGNGTERPPERLPIHRDTPRQMTIVPEVITGLHTRVSSPAKRTRPGNTS